VPLSRKILKKLYKMTLQ